MMHGTRGRFSIGGAAAVSAPALQAEPAVAEWRNVALDERRRCIWLAPSGTGRLGKLELA